MLRFLPSVGKKFHFIGIGNVCGRTRLSGQADRSRHPHRRERILLIKNSFDEILTISEVSAELRCSKVHVYNAINGKVAGVTEVRGRFGAPARCA